MQPNRGEMQAMGVPMNGLSRPSKPPTATVTTQIALHEFHNNGHPLIQNRNLQRPSCHFDPTPAATEDFFDQMLSNILSCPDLTKSHWDFTGGGSNKQVTADDGLHFEAPYDQSSLLAARLRQQQINSGGSLVGKPMVVPISAQQQQHQLLLSAMAGSGQSPANASATNSGLFPPMPPSIGGPAPGADSDSTFKSLDSTGVGFSAGQLQHFHHPQGASMPQQCFGGSPPQASSSPAIAAGACCGGAPRVAAPRQRVRARRGQATDPHSIAERLRRERIAERMKALQELVPNANKTDKASMLEEIIDYVKFLQLQVKVLSMSRLGGSAAVSPLMADVPSEGRGSAAAASGTISETESLVARLMEEDMGSAMQYLQGKGLCLMPISLASAISTVTSPSTAGRPVSRIPAGVDAPPSSPSMSVLTVQSAIAGGGGGDTGVSRSSGKDVA